MSMFSRALLNGFLGCYDKVHCWSIGIGAEIQGYFTDDVTSGFASSPGLRNYWF